MHAVFSLNFNRGKIIRIVTSFLHFLVSPPTSSLCIMPRPTRRAANAGHGTDGGTEFQRSRELMHKHSSLWKTADADGNKMLSFQEFVLALPVHIRKVHALSDILAWFSLIDTSGDGVVSANEFFCWSLSSSSIGSGSGLVHAFSRHDVDRVGRLDERAFYRAVESVGFGDDARTLFTQMPLTSDGRFAYYELLGLTTNDAGAYSSAAKSFITSMAWHENGAPGPKWSCEATDAEAVRDAINELLRWHCMLIVDLFSLLDTSRDAVISVDEFLLGIEKVLGFAGERSLLRATFDAIDVSGDGEITLQELVNWMAQTSTRAVDPAGGVGSACNTLAELDRMVDGLVLQVKDDDEEWDRKRLRRELCWTLQAASVRVEDMLARWDRMGLADTPNTANLSRRAFLVHCKRLVRNGHALPSSQLAIRIGSHAEVLWDAKNVRGAALAFFDHLDVKKNGVLRLSELAEGILFEHTATEEALLARKRERRHKRRQAEASASSSKNVAPVGEAEKDLWTPAVQTLFAKYTIEPLSPSAHLAALSAPRRRRHNPARRRATVNALAPPSLPPLPQASRLRSDTHLQCGLRESVSLPLLVPQVDRDMLRSRLPRAARSLAHEWLKKHRDARTVRR
jgi:Ca2+-binding EF-hand superfamily protein